MAERDRGRNSKRTGDDCETLPLIESLNTLERQRTITIGLHRRAANDYWAHTSKIGAAANIGVLVIIGLVFYFFLFVNWKLALLALVGLGAYVWLIEKIGSTVVRIRLLKNEALFQDFYDASWATIRVNSTGDIIRSPADWRPHIERLATEDSAGSINSAQKGIVQLPKTLDPLVVVVSRDEVEAGDVSPALSTLQRFIESPEVAREFFERIDIAFHGYDHDSRELFEIPEVRDFVHRLDEGFPFWLFFLSKRHLGLQCLLFCFLPPFLTEEARSQIFPERIDQLLSHRWFPAMNQICEYTGFSEQQIEQLTDRVIRYITKGRFPIDS